MSESAEGLEVDRRFVADLVQRGAFDRMRDLLDALRSSPSALRRARRRIRRTRLSVMPTRKRLLLAADRRRPLWHQLALVLVQFSTVAVYGLLAFGSEEKSKMIRNGLILLMIVASVLPIARVLYLLMISTDRIMRLSLDSIDRIICWSSGICFFGLATSLLLWAVWPDYRSRGGDLSLLMWWGAGAGLSLCGRRTRMLRSAVLVEILHLMAMMSMIFFYAGLKISTSADRAIYVYAPLLSHLTLAFGVFGSIMVMRRERSNSTTQRSRACFGYR